MTRPIKLTLCFWLGLMASAARAAPLRLADVLARVDEHGLDQRAAEAQVPIARAEVLTARMFPNPALVLGAGHSEPVFNAALQLRLPIFGQRGAHISAAQAGVRQSEDETAALRWRLRHDARIAYYGVARADEEAAIAAEVEALSQRIATMAQQRYEVGSGTRLDERQAALVHIRALQDVSDRQALARVARIELARQLVLPSEALGAIADPLATIGQTTLLDELLSQLRDRHPALRALRSEREAARLRARASRSDLRPTLGLEAGVEVLDPQTCGGSAYCVGPRGALSFDLPVFNLNRGPVERALAEMRVAEAKAAAAERHIEADVRAAYETLEAASARVRFFDTEYVPSAIEVEGMAREGYAVGRSGILPLIEAERAVLDARLGRAEALYAVQAARADLEEASGLPLSTP